MIEIMLCQLDIDILCRMSICISAAAASGGVDVDYEHVYIGVLSMCFCRGEYVHLHGC